MASAIDVTVPADNVKVEKTDIRRNFATASEEIGDLQRKTSTPWRIAFGQQSV